MTVWIKISDSEYLRPSHLRLFCQEGEDRWAVLGDGQCLASGLPRVEAVAYMLAVVGVLEGETVMMVDIRVRPEGEWELK